ncbi:MAG: PhnD/SsuA/transferrin family substrate-binding protein [Planctomycetota bacterium]
MFEFRFLFITVVSVTMSFFAQTEMLPAQQTVTSGESPEALTIVVMDPLCDRLACDCVEGYAQRKYEVLGEYLTDRLQRQVDVFWGESIQAALEERDKTADIVIGKHSVVMHNASDLEIALSPVAQLTGSDGSVMQTGLIVVRSSDAAVTVSDLQGYRIFFGPEDCDEKFSAPRKLLLDAGIELQADPEISGACSEAAMKLMELDEEVRAAAVISSYAEPLLSGCGTIEQGDLKVIGISDEVPFVSVFLNEQLPADIQASISEALLAAGAEEKILTALETAEGFLPYEGVPDGEADGEPTASGAGGTAGESTVGESVAVENDQKKSSR